MDNGPNETQKITELAVKVKQMARDSNVAVLVLSDITKDDQGKIIKGEEFTLNSLRGSNRIGHAADTVIGLSSEGSKADGGKASRDPWEIYAEKINSSEKAQPFIESLMTARKNHPIGGDSATVYARLELIKNRSGQGRGNQFLLYHRAYHKFEEVSLNEQEKAEGRG
jgi:replicative DNA helicase